MNKWGYLRETAEQARKAGTDPDTGLHRTGLNEYLTVIFPDVDDWIHDQTTGLIKNGKKSKLRPDYRSEKLKMIIEFDGLPHYTDPQKIILDFERTAFYQANGYRVVRIPYFIQLTNTAVETLFNVIVNEPLFDESYPSIGPKGHNTPAFLCISGIKRMAKEFHKFPEQYKTNVDYLKNQPDQRLVEVAILEYEYAHTN